MRFRTIIAGLFLLLLIPGIVPAQSSRFSTTVTAGIGGAFPAGNLTNQFHNAPTFSGNLDFRLLKNFSAEIGAENILPNYDNYSHYGAITSRERVTLLPYGLRGILPLANHRAELLVGTGGAYFWHSDNTGYYNETRTLWQANAGGRIALDRARHCWLGTTVRLYRDLGRPTQQWLSLTGDFGFRFGR